MPVPFFPVVGLLQNLTLLDPSTVFTPLSCGLFFLSSLCGLGIGFLIDRAYATPVQGTAAPATTPVFSEAA